jgi:hypothetical protein
MVTVAEFEGMDDETAIKHLEHRHAEQLGGLVFHEEPDRAGQPRRLRGGKFPWDLYHARLHRGPGGVAHDHGGA